MTIVVSNNITNVQASDSAAARADRLLAEAAAAKATGVVPTTTGVIRANSIAALRTNTPVANQVAIVSGYYNNGDGGGGEFYGVTGGTYTDDGGMTIVPGGGTATTAWKRIVSGPINIKWFGAKGDGVKDDTIAIQSAINIADTLASSTGYTVYAPSGDYKITATINFPYVVSNLFGDGMDNTRFMCDSVSGSVFKCTNNSYFRPIWSNFSIIDQTLSTTGFGIDVTGLNWAGGAQMFSFSLTNIRISVKGAALACYAAFSGTFNNVVAASSTGHSFLVNCGPAVSFINCYAVAAGTGKAGYRLCGNINLYACNGVNNAEYWGVFGQNPLNTTGFNNDFPNFTDSYPSVYLEGCNIEYVKKCGIQVEASYKYFRLEGCGIDQSAVSTNYVSLMRFVIPTGLITNPVYLGLNGVLLGASVATGPSGALTNAYIYADNFVFVIDTNGVAENVIPGIYCNNVGSLYPIMHSNVINDIYGNYAMNVSALTARRLNMQMIQYKTKTVTPVGTNQVVDVSGYTKIIITPAAAASVYQATFSNSTGTGAVTDFGRNGDLLIEAGNANLTIVHSASGGNTFRLSGGTNLTLTTGQVARFCFSNTSSQWIQV